MLYYALWSPSSSGQSPLATSLEVETLSGIQAEIENVVNSSSRACVTAGRAIAYSLEDSADTWDAMHSLRPILWGSLKGSEYFTSAGFQSTSNLSEAFVRTGSRITEYIRDRPDAPNITGFEVLNASGRSSPIPTVFVSTPPLQERNWYVSAVAQKDQAVLTTVLSVLGYPVVISSFAVSDSMGTLRGVVNLGLDMGLIVSNLASRDHRTFTTTYVTSRSNGNLLPLTPNPNATEFVNVYNSTNPLVSESARKLGDALYDERDYNLQMRLRGRRYFVGAKKLLNSINLTVVVLMPRNYFFARVDRNRTFTIGIFCAVMSLWAVFALVVGAAFVRLRKREKILRAAAQHDSEQHKIKQVLLTRLSHELRTPMTVVMGLLEELQNDCKQDDLKDHVSLLKKTTNDMLHLLDGILMLAKNEAGKTNVEKQLFDLKVELKAALSAIAPLVAPQGVITSLKYGEHIPTEFVGDRRVLRQILDNLLSNAAKFTDCGRIEIEVSPRPSRREDQYTVEILVRDTGIGIPLDRQEAIFEEFVQADEHIKHIYGGSGLGLSIVRSLCRLMGGDIAIETSSNRGTCFKFWLELGIPSASIRRSAIVSETMRNEEAPLQGIHVLVAEDTRLISKIIEKSLTKEGARATMSEDGKAALDIYCERPFDYHIILMDLQMPRMDGYEATKQIRQLESEGALPGQIPIVALTAHAMENDATKCREVGMQDYVRKPWDRKTMLSTILRLARSKRLSRSGSV